MLTVHHLGVSQSERIVWLCEELGLDYVLKRYDRDPVMAPPDLKALSPFETAPVITDGDLVLGETGAIIDYIVAKYDGGRLTVSAEKPNFADYLFWYHFANGSMMPSAMGAMILQMVGGGDGRAAPFITARVDKAWALVEQRLGEAPFFGGDDLTIADINMVFPLTTMRQFAPRDLTPYPNVRAYLSRIGARPAYQAAMAKGDPGMPLLLD